MKIKEFKKRDIKTIPIQDLRIVLNTTLNKSIREQITKELINRETNYREIN